MQLVRLKDETDFEGWRDASRALLAQNIPPEDVDWRQGEGSNNLFDTPEFMPNTQQSQQVTVPRDFIDLCRKAILHSDPSRFALLYRLLWRLKQEPGLLRVSFDPDVAKTQAMAQAVRRDLHKMKAFVRFREIELEGGESEFVAWFEPSQHIVKASASFFTGRFTNMRWSILTPEICMHWDGKTLSYSPGANKADAPAEDAGEELWRSYYRSIFNPARLKVSAMQSQMPKKYWRNLPEAELIADLVANADKRKNEMIAAQATVPQRKVVKYVAKKDILVPLADLGDAANALRELNDRMLASTEFPLAAHATQAVLGTGIAPATIMLLGEQPGEQEDLAGQPFIGPAGKLLDQAFLEAGIARSEAYVTNALKHYKFKLQGTRRMHMVPSVGDIKTYLPWLQAEIAIVQPQVIIALGAIAARAITGEELGIEDNRGKLFSLADGRQALVTYHPSFILRTPDKASKQLRYERLVADLKSAVKFVASTAN
ncbi:MAG: UdgX family uracil-DNA binding protein [Pseudomonadota bacterium]